VPKKQKKTRAPRAAAAPPLRFVQQPGGHWLHTGEPQLDERELTVLDQVAAVWLRAPGNPGLDVEGETRKIVDAADAEAHRRQRARERAGGKKGSVTRSDNARARWLMIEELKKRMGLSDFDACYKWLDSSHNDDPKWDNYTEREKAVKARSMAQLVSNARRKARRK
jgi:hypothetical protein